MKTFFTLTFLLITSGFLMSQTYNVSATINGAMEVPANASPGSGTLSGTYDAATNSIVLSVAYTGLSGTLTAAHLHKAPAGTNGGVIVNLSPTTGSSSGTISGTFSIAAADEAELITGNVYVNLHSTTFGGGEIRGQLALVANVPQCEVDIAQGDLCIRNNERGVVLKSPNGSCFRIKVGDDGVLTSTPINCM